MAGKEGAGEECGTVCRAGAGSTVRTERDIRGDGDGAADVAVDGRLGLVAALEAVWGRVETGDGVLGGCASCFGGAASLDTALCCGWLAAAGRKVPARKGWGSEAVWGWLVSVGLRAGVGETGWGSFTASGTMVCAVFADADARETAGREAAGLSGRACKAGAAVRTLSVGGVVAGMTGGGATGICVWPEGGWTACTECGDAAGADIAGDGPGPETAAAAAGADGGIMAEAQ